MCKTRFDSMGMYFSLVKFHFKPFMHFCCKLANVTNSAFFGSIFLPKNFAGVIFLDKYLVCVQPKQERNRDLCIKSWNCEIAFGLSFLIWQHICKCGTFPGFWYFCRFFQVFVSPTFASVVFFQVWIRRLQHSNAVKHNVLHRLILRNVLHCHLKFTKKSLLDDTDFFFDLDMVGLPRCRW